MECWNLGPQPPNGDGHDDDTDTRSSATCFIASGPVPGQAAAAGALLVIAGLHLLPYALWGL